MPWCWIDFSKNERSKILTVLDLLSEDSTLDELGIAPIRDGFANLFFPGTSTIQTRAKYFFLVPYILRDLENSKNYPETRLNKILKILDDLERKYAERLIEVDENEKGIIGKLSLHHGKWVKRSPSSIYWAGLRKYGIFRGGNLSLSEYIREMSAIKKQKADFKNLGSSNDQAEDFERDDLEAGDIRQFSYWNMPLYSEKWSDDFSMKLTDQEGSFLKEQIIKNCPDSMIAFILENQKEEILNINSFQNLESIIHEFPLDMQINYQNALKFSNFFHVLSIIYNVIVSKGENEKATNDFTTVQPYFGELASVDLDAITRLLSISNYSLVLFLKRAQELMKSNKMDDLEQLIKDREIAIKGSQRAKTCHQGEFDPNKWQGMKDLDYRFFISRRIIRDIFESEVTTSLTPEVYL